MYTSYNIRKIRKNAQIYINKLKLQIFYIQKNLLSICLNYLQQLVLFSVNKYISMNILQLF